MWLQIVLDVFSVIFIGIELGLIYKVSAMPTIASKFNQATEKDSLSKDKNSIYSQFNKLSTQITDIISSSIYSIACIYLIWKNLPILAIILGIEYVCDLIYDFGLLFRIIKSPARKVELQAMKHNDIYAKAKYLKMFYTYCSLNSLLFALALIGLNL